MDYLHKEFDLAEGDVVEAGDKIEIRSRAGVKSELRPTAARTHGNQAAIANRESNSIARL